MEPNTIDFLRDDLGLWVLHVTIPFLALAGLRPAELRREGWGRLLRAVLIRLLVGQLITAPITGFLQVWQRWPPQYFITLRLESKQVVLGFRWPEPDKIIPLADIRSVAIVERKSMRRPTRRVRIESVDGTYRSYGFYRLDEPDASVVRALRRAVESSAATNR